MKKSVSAAVIAAILIAGTVGCTGSVPPGTQSVPPPDSVITESDSPAVHRNDSSTLADESVHDAPPDTESVAETRGNIGFMNHDEESDDGKILNIFCNDETFMDIIVRYCDGYVQLSGEDGQIEEAESNETAEEGTAAEEGRSDEAAEEGLTSGMVGSNTAAPENLKSDETEDGARYADDDLTVIRGKIGEADVRFIICRKEGEDYLTSLDLSLLPGPFVNDVTDLYIVDAADVQKYVDREANAAQALIRDLGISSQNLASQYVYTKILGSGSDAVQRAVSYEVSPGVFMYSREAALKVLGSDEPSVVGERLNDWERFDAVAAEAASCGYAMLSDWNDSFDAYAAGIDGDWLTETGGVRIDSALLGWTAQAELYGKEGYYANDDGREIFGTFITANELMELVNNTDMTADDFKGQYGICPGPCGWYRGGSYIAVNPESDQKALCRKILGQTVLDKDTLTLMKAEDIIPNSQSILPAAINTASPVMKFLCGQDPYPVFAEAASRIKLGKVSMYDRYLCDVYKRECASYFAGEKDRNSAMKVFYTEVTSLISEEE